MSPKKKTAPPWDATPSAPAAPPEAPLLLPRFSNGWRFLLYPLCVLQPAAGLAFSALYLAQTDAMARRFGRICLVLSLIGLCLKAYRGNEDGGFRTGDSLLQPFY